MGADSDGNPLLFYPGDYNIVVPGHRDIDYRERVLEAHGVDAQVVTLTTPGTHVETALRSYALDVDETTRAAIRGGNAVRLLGLQGR